jgi:hypothetical protein
MDPLWITLGIVLLFPDRNLGLDPFDNPMASVDGIVSMGGSHCDYHAGFTDRDATESMDKGDSLDLPLLSNPGCEF